jgi:hypothetical protein
MGMVVVLGRTAAIRYRSTRQRQTTFFHEHDITKPRSTIYSIGIVGPRPFSASTELLCRDSKLRADRMGRSRARSSILLLCRLLGTTETLGPGWSLLWEF